MPFINLPGVKGKVFVPEDSGPKKHACKDCFHCLWCYSDRCKACLEQKKKKCKEACVAKKQIKRRP